MTRETGHLAVIIVVLAVSCQASRSPRASSEPPTRSSSTRRRSNTRLAFREEVDRGARSLADEIVRLLFTPDSNRDGTPVEPSTDQIAPEPQFPVSPKPGQATH